MKADDVMLMNCGNDFYPHLFGKLCEALEGGQVVHVFVDCIGHTRNNTVQEIYKEKLIEKYGDAINSDCNEGGYSYSYVHRLIK